MRQHFEQMHGLLAYRYAGICFSEEWLKHINVRFQLFDLDHEIVDDDEKTTWLEFEFKFMLVYDNNSILVDFQRGLEFIKNDYCPLIKASDAELNKKLEMDEMQTGQQTTIDADAAKRIVARARALGATNEKEQTASK